MAVKSAGILLFRRVNPAPEFFLVHPGGPFWKNKDQGAWSIPKGEYTDEEDPFTAALREFQEETGMSLDGSKAISLGDARMKSGKIISAWGIEGDIDPRSLKSNEFEIDWPPGSGKKQSFPEVDKAGWFDLERATALIHPAQKVFLERVTLH